MAMHQGFDLSRFKKVSSDDKATTMRHSNGHEVKIVHSALSPKMREQIESLPMHDQAPQKMARGGAVKKMAGGGDPSDPQAMDPDSPATADDMPPGADLSEVNAANRPPGIPPPPTAGDGTDDGSAEPDEDQSAADNTIDVIGQRPTPTMARLAQEQDAWLHDQQNGHITPETYQSLFAKKDTLGKIGSIFGLIVGGAGSGLAHQQNMAMDMMNRTIQNDLDAQKTSKHNAVSYYNAAVNMLQGTANADNVASHMAMNNMRLSVYQHLFDKISKMPPGPYQQQGMAMLKQMMPAIQAANAKNNAQAVLAAHQDGESGQSTFNGPVNGDAISALGLVSPELGGPAQNEASRVFNTRNLFDNYTHAHDRLDSLAAGQSSEALKTASDAVAGFIPMSSLAGSVAELAKNLQQERQAEIQAMPGVPEQFLPSGYDYVPGQGGDKTRAEKSNRAAAWFKLQEGYTPTLNMLQKNGTNVITPQPYEHWAGSKRQKMQPRGIGDRKQPLATPEEAKAGNVFPEPKGGK